MRRAILIGSAVMLATGCATRSFPVRLQGDPTSIERLAGSWTGEYWGAAAGRAGSLSFALRGGTDSLYGDVLMISSTGQSLHPADPVDIHRAHVRMSQQLRIDFVAVRGDTIRGTLEPYISPDCGCALGTTFLGQVRGNTISGTFESRHAGSVVAAGRWEMRRVKDTARKGPHQHLEKLAGG